MSSKQVQKVLIVANWGKEEAHSLSATIKSYIEEKGIECTIWRTTVEQDKPIVAEDTDLVICLGGDGTVLYCARHLQTLGIPILAINLGTFGYITEISVNEWKEAVDRFPEGSYTLSRRLMIRAGVYRKGDGSSPPMASMRSLSPPRNQQGDRDEPQGGGDSCRVLQGGRNDHRHSDRLDRLQPCSGRTDS